MSAREDSVSDRGREVSARVMLMVQRTPGATMSSFPVFSIHAPPRIGYPFGCPGLLVSRRAVNVKTAAHAWWLVEADPASAARKVIAACEEAAKAVREAGGVSYDPTSTRWAFGRVLAHGGKR